MTNELDDALRLAENETQRLRAALHHVKRMADGDSAAWHIADCALNRLPVPLKFCAEEFAGQSELPEADVRALIEGHIRGIADAIGVPCFCDDCPPVGYPTDKMRCLPCPRRADTSSEKQP